MRRARHPEPGLNTTPNPLVTVIHNGVLVQDNVEIKGTTVNSGAPKYTAHPLNMPLLLQDHRNPVHFRNIWIPPL